MLPEPRDSEAAPGGATLCTILPFVLLVALLAWVYPLTAQHGHPNHRTPQPTSSPAAPR